MNRKTYHGSGFCIYEYEDGRYEIEFDVGHFTPKFEAFEISKENAQKALRSPKDAGAVMTYAQTGHWPLTPEEQQELNREFIRENPQVLLLNPDNQRLFEEEELKKLLEEARRRKKS